MRKYPSARDRVERAFVRGGAEGGMCLVPYVPANSGRPLYFAWWWGRTMARQDLAPIRAVRSLAHEFASTLAELDSEMPAAWLGAVAA